MHTLGNKKLSSKWDTDKEGKFYLEASLLHLQYPGIHFMPEITLFSIVNRYSRLQMHGYTPQRFANNVA